MARSERVWGAPQQAFFLCVYTQELLAILQKPQNKHKKTEAALTIIDMKKQFSKKIVKISFLMLHLGFLTCFIYRGVNHSHPCVLDKTM